MVGSQEDATLEASLGACFSTELDFCFFWNAYCWPFLACSLAGLAAFLETLTGSASGTYSSKLGRGYSIVSTKSALTKCKLARVMASKKNW